MAIISACPGLTVQILVNGVPLQEYDDEDEEANSPSTVTKYIEAKSDAQFSVSYRSSQPLPEQQSILSIFLDGEHVVGAAQRKGDFRLNETYIRSGRTSVIGQDTVIQAFQFNEITTVDSSDNCSDKGLLHKLKSAGTIKVTMQGIKNPVRCSAASLIQLNGVKEVPEKALKGQAKTHTATLAEARQAPATSWHTYELIGSGPFASFYFNYRSLAALRMLGVVPREPTPVLLENRPEDELSPGELRQLVKQLKERDAANLKVKSERTDKRKYAALAGDDSDGRDQVEVTEVRNKKRYTHDPNEVIVLD